MASSTTEESHEVKAIKQHISTFKSQISTTTNNVSSAKSNMDAAIAMYAALQSQLDVSKKELKDVEKLLVEAEQRAVNDDNDHVKLEGGSNKRRKVSPPPQDDTNTNNSAGVTVKMEENNDHAYDEETDKEDEDESTNQANKSVNNSNTNAASASKTSSRHPKDIMNSTARHQSTNDNKEGALGNSAANATGVASQSTSSNIQIVLEDCGSGSLNGTYTKVVGQMYDGAPVYIDIKRIYIIYRDSMSMGPNNWYIGWFG